MKVRKSGKGKAGKPARKPLSGKPASKPAQGLRKPGKAPEPARESKARRTQPIGSQNGASRKAGKPGKGRKPATYPDGAPWATDSPEARLCRMVDKSCLTWDGFLETHKRDIKQAKIKLTPKLVARAKAYERQWESYMKDRVLRIGGTYNGERRIEQPPEELDILKLLKKDRKKSFSIVLIALTLDMKVSVAKRHTLRLYGRGMIGKTPNGYRG
jgi:hypothetical protein